MPRGWARGQNLGHLIKCFLAYLSRRLTGELLVYPCSGVRRRRRPSTFSNIFFSETTWPIKAKFYVEPPWVGGTKVCSRHLGHMTKMAARPIYGKNPSKIFFSRTGRPIFTKTWYVASWTPAHHNLFKWWPWVDLDLFYGRVKFGNLGFSMGKSENCWFFRTFAAWDLKPTEKRNICEYWRSRSFLDLGPRSFTYKT